MANTSAKEDYAGRTSEIADGVRRHARIFIVRTDDADDTSHDAMTGAGVPNIGDLHPGDAVAEVVRKRAEPTENYTAWRVTVDYSTDEREQDAAEEMQSNRQDEYSWEWVEETEPYFKDETTPTAKFVVNSAGERFEQMPERRNGYLICNVTRYTTSFDQDTHAEYAFVVNSDTVTIDSDTIPVGEALMLPTRAEKRVENGNTFYIIRYRIARRDGGWDHVVLDVGFQELANAGADRAPILDENGVPVETPWPLDGAGAAKANADDDPAELTFKPYAAKAFSGFSFS